MAEQGDAAGFIRDAPFEVVRALLGRLSPKWILRMRSVCSAWRGKLCNGALLVLLRRAEPPRLLLCFDRYAQLKDYCVESLDLRSGKLRAVFRFADNDFYGGFDDDDNDLEGRGDRDAPAPPPIIDDDFRRVGYERMENHAAGEEEAVSNSKGQVTVHASIDGLLLVSFSSRRRWYIINPATRHWVSLFDLSAFGFNVVGFYEHGPSGKYRVLCLSRRSNVVREEAEEGGEAEGEEEEAPTCSYSYHVVEVRPAQRRHIGRRLSPAARKDHGLASGVEKASISPPVQWKRNMELLWPPQERQGNHLLVFDTRREVFSWKRPPRVIMRADQDMRLLEFPDGRIGLSIYKEDEATLDLWCLQVYENDEDWVLKHRIELAALQQMPALHLHGGGGGRPWVVPAVVLVSAEGDALIESPHGLFLFHRDRDGSSLRRFWFHQAQNTQSSGSQRVLPVRHVLRKSLVHHPMFWPSKYASEPPFLCWLSSDPSR